MVIDLRGPYVALRNDYRRNTQGMPAANRAEAYPLTPDDPAASISRDATLGRPIRVCLLGPSLDILGGQAVQLDRLLRGLRGSKGVEVGFIPMNPRLPGPFRALQQIKYVRTVVTSIAYVFSLFRQLRRYDVIHVFSPSYWAFLLGPVPAMAVGRLYGRGVILNYHSGEAADHLATWRTAIPLARLAHRIIVPSGYLREVFAGFGLSAEEIHNFVDTDAIPHRVRTRVRPVFLSNRNLEPLYNVACCIRAFGRIQSRVPSASLTIAGFGSERARLERLVAELGLTSVRFTGRVPPDEMAALLDDADVLLNSPDIDNMPLSLIEALAAGLPIVSTRTGGIPWIVEDGVTGLLVAPGDDSAMADAALRLLNERGLAESISRAGRAVCERSYTWAAVEPRWLHAYRDVATMARTSSVLASA